MASDGDHPLAFLDDHLVFREQRAHVLDQLLFGDERAPKGSVARHDDLLAHHHLAARIVGDGAAQGVLLEQADVEPLLFAGDGASDARGPATNDDDIGEVVAGLAELELAPQRLSKDQALAEGVFDQTHAAELADDEHARAARLKRRSELRQVNAALGGAKHQLDGADRTLDSARAVADAMRRLHQGRDAVDDADDLALGTRLDAREAADAHRRIDHRVQRERDELALGDSKAQPLEVF